jgi:hypothetical protein
LGHLISAGVLRPTNATRAFASSEISSTQPVAPKIKPQDVTKVTWRQPDCTPPRHRDIHNRAEQQEHHDAQRDSANSMMAGALSHRV